MSIERSVNNKQYKNSDTNISDANSKRTSQVLSKVTIKEPSAVNRVNFRQK